MTFAQLRAQLQRHGHSSALQGLNLLWEVAQQAWGQAAGPEAVDVTPLLLLWTDPGALEDCRQRCSSAGRTHSLATLELLAGLRELLASHLVQPLLGEQQQQQLCEAVTALHTECVAAHDRQWPSRNITPATTTPAAAGRQQAVRGEGISKLAQLL